MKEILEKIFRKLEEIQQVVSKQNKSSIMGLDECSAYLKISRNTIYHWTSTHRIPFYRLGKKLLFRVSEIQDWAFQHQHKVKSEEEIKSEIATRSLIQEIGGEND